MRKGRDGEWKKLKKKKTEKKKIMVKIVATTSLPVDRLTATDCNAAARAKRSPKDQKMQGQISIFTYQIPVTLSKYSYALNKTYMTIVTKPYEAWTNFLNHHPFCCL